MRHILESFLAVGIKRCRFQAQFSGLSPRGHSILNDVQPPVGYIQHLWVRQTLKAERGATVHFLASIQAYEHDSGDLDFTLAELELVA